MRTLLRLVIPAVTALCLLAIPPQARAFEHVVDLELQLETTSDWARYTFEDLQVFVVSRSLDVEGGGYVRSDGGFLAKSSYNTAKTRLTARMRAIVTGPSPRLILGKGNAGASRLVLRSGKTVLAEVAHDGVIKGDDRNRRYIPLRPERLFALPGSRLRHFPRRALAFYYGWYGTPNGPTQRWRHWNPRQSHHDSLNRPVGGWYDSLDASVVERHCAQAVTAGLDGLILSWWTDHKRNERLLKLLLPAASRHGLKVSIYIETAAGAKALRKSLKALIAGPGKDPAWLMADGKPVFFLYTRVLGQLNPTQLKSATVGLDAFIVGDTLSDKRLGEFDALHTYYMARKPEQYRQKMHTLRLLTRLQNRRLVATVMPGYDDTRVRTPGFVRGRGAGAFLHECFRAAMGADWVLLTSFNEWHEGSEIEPSQEHGQGYLERFAKAVARWKAGP